MKQLLNKELKLAMHPVSLMFLALSAMLLIPNYPYYVTFFYTTLGIFFICLTGRENHDIFYTMCLPVRKRDVVRSRIAIAVGLELTQVALAIPFACIRNTFSIPGNQGGMDANVAFFGMALLMLGLFNLVFFTSYYKKPASVGAAFAQSSILVFVFIVVAEACTFAVPFVRDRLDTPDPAYLGAKLCVLILGIGAFVLLTLTACRRAERSFEDLDL